MEITPAAIVVVPLALVALQRRKWSLVFLVGSAPFVSLTVVTAISHEFTPSEIILIGLIGKQVFKWLKRGSVVFDDERVSGWLVLFGVFCVLSVVYAAIRPTDVLVHPYNVGGFGTFLFEPFSFSTANITQLLLRLFFVVSVFVIAKTIEGRTEVRQIVRWLILMGLLVGSVGVIYQLTVVTNHPLAGVLRWIGFNRFPDHPGFTGPLPRMYSLPGEPGFTADYLLFTLALAVTLFLSGEQNGILSRRESGIMAGLLFVFLLLSTGTTGYGGLVILGGILTMKVVTIDRMRTRELRTVVVSTLVVIPIGLVSDVLLFRGQLQRMVGYELGKLVFQTGSGTIRLQYMLRTLELVRVRPLLGVGVGSHHVPSLLFTVLGEVGILGLAVFIAFHLSLYRRCGWLAFYDKTSQYDILALTLFVAGMTLFLTNLIAKSVSTLLFPWYWFSLALPMVLIGQRAQAPDYES